ncbi:MAG: TetR/AcrR family transcriptional regulator [Clostridia bacterium]|nr:TetR/AcrR family transcriptional regulator [Clostridia bacterium]
MNTKEKILKEALTLFAEKGYSAVYVSDIADAVGIKAPSLYKHYKSKQEIFDSCVEVFSKRMEQVRTDLCLPDTTNAEVNYQTADMDMITSIAVNLFMFYLQDDVASKFRKMLMIERYHNPELNTLFENLFIDGAVKHEEKIFSDLIESKIIKKENPHIIALRFYTPIFYLLQKYEMHPDMVEEAKQELTLMVQEFCNTYRAEEH